MHGAPCYCADSDKRCSDVSRMLSHSGQLHTNNRHSAGQRRPARHAPRMWHAAVILSHAHQWPRSIIFKHAVITNQAKSAPRKTGVCTTILCQQAALLRRARRGCRASPQARAAPTNAPACMAPAVPAPPRRGPIMLCCSHCAAHSMHWPMADPRLTGLCTSVAESSRPPACAASAAA